MNEKREQLEYLLSQRLDGPLFDADARTLEQALADDASLAAEAASMARLDAMLKAWRPVPAVDWRRYQARVGEALRASEVSEPIESSEDDAAFDTVLRDGVSSMPDVDWSAFNSRVSATVRREAERDALLEPAVPATSPMRWVFRAAVPLAAAAAIALAIWLPRDGLTTTEPDTTAREPIVLVSLEIPPTGGTVRIAFAETPVEEMVDPRTTPRGIALGGAAAQAARPVAVDEAWFY
jgi:hypothetical protein